MKFQPVAAILRLSGLRPPDLRLLAPNHENYTALILQPRGKLEATTGVRHLDSHLAAPQFRAFLQEAHCRQAELAISPEYSMPWDVLVEELRENRSPRPGALWALGCESITHDELLAVKASLHGHAHVLFEELEPAPGRFLDPLVYVFRASREEGEDATELVLVVQFKTQPMADNAHFELNGMQRGTVVYQFGERPQLRLLSLICSDALAFNDELAREAYDRTLILHLQLNPHPSQEHFRNYRTQLLGFQGDQTEILCINWTPTTTITTAAGTESLARVGGTAWYLRPDKFDDGDATLTDSHCHGLYYTWCQSLRSHVLFFSYHPGVFEVVASKVAHVGVNATLSRRVGPKSKDMLLWDDSTHRWVSVPTVDDGFAATAKTCEQIPADVVAGAAARPLDIERLLALSAGEIGHSHQWYTPRSLDSCRIDSSEEIRRMTYCPPPQTSAAAQFREGRLQRVAHLNALLADGTHLPLALADLRDGFRLEWHVDSPHQNVVSTKGERATVIYLGDDATPKRAEEVRSRAAEYLRLHAAEDEQSIAAKQRLVVLRRAPDGVHVHYDQRQVRFDTPRTDSEYDIARPRQ